MSLRLEESVAASELVDKVKTYFQSEEHRKEFETWYKNKYGKNYDYFTLSRMEDNQITAMTCWKWRGNEYAYFAIKLSSEMIYMIDFDTLCLEMQKGTKRISDFSKYPTLEEWTEDDNIWKSK